MRTHLSHAHQAGKTDAMSFQKSVCGALICQKNTKNV